MTNVQLEFEWVCGLLYVMMNTLISHNTTITKRIPFSKKGFSNTFYFKGNVCWLPEIALTLFAKQSPIRSICITFVKITHEYLTVQQLAQATGILLTKLPLQLYIYIYIHVALGMVVYIYIYIHIYNICIKYFLNTMKWVLYHWSW